MWNEIKKLFWQSTKKGTSDEAKGRLLLVLAHDRAGIDGAKLQDLRTELAAVIAKYVDIDPGQVEIQIERVSRESTQLTVHSPLPPRSATEPTT